MAEWRDIVENPRHARAITQFSMEFIMNFFTIARMMVGNDFDAALVLLTIQVYVGEKAFRLNERNVRNMSFAETFPDELLVPISRLAIANLTGLPKETVRRKVMKLEKLGFIRRVGTRGLAISHEFAAGEKRAQVMVINLTAAKKFLERLSNLTE